MRFRVILTMATLFMACSTAAVFAKPLPANDAEAGKRPPENQSVSGQIASVGDAVFTVNITSKDKDQQKPQTVDFLVDGKTKVEGKMAIGAQALVEYRSDSGKNIAVHVVVTPASGVSLW